MKRTLISVLSVLLAAVMLVGSACAEDPGSGREQYAARQLCSFDEMPYERPDSEAFSALADRLCAAIENGESYRRVAGMLDDLYAAYNSADTMLTIADIRNCQDMTDEYYAAEYTACRLIAAEISQSMERVYLACGSSRFAEKLEKEYFWEGFLDDYGPDAEDLMTEEYLALLRQETELIAEYRAAAADPSVEYRGRELPFLDALDSAGSWYEYLALYNRYYEKYNPILGEIYLRLMEIRKAQALLLGYDSYAEMAYDLIYDRDFSIEEAAAFAESVKKYLVPLYRESGAPAQQEELLDRYVSEEELYAVLESLSGSLGAEARETYDFMKKYDLIDISMSERKPDMSFQAYLADYEAPYLFVSPYGDTSDIITVTHEFGHCVDAFASFNCYRSIDLAEVFSQAMQFLSLGHLEGVLGKDGVEDLRRLNILDSLDTFIQQASFMEFEQRAFSMEEPTLEKLNALSLELAQEYGYYDGFSKEYYAMSWIDIPHFFEQAFYVISYPVSLGVALEIYEIELASDGVGFAKFMELIDAEEPGIVAAAREVGLHAPLADARVREIAAFLSEQLAA